MNLTPELLVAAAIVASLVLYFLFGGADFGGGVWDLLASGPRRQEQRALVERAIGPIWEANHVWLILVVVLVFTGFPRAFAVLSVAFHVPLSLFLVGIVFRGSSFAFRSFDASSARNRWGLAFSIASVVSPVLLGMVVGGVASGRVVLTGGSGVAPGSGSAWLGVFPLATGLLALAGCAYLAATYLTHEAASGGEHALAEDFRRRALIAAVVLALLAIVALLLARSGAPRIADRLTRSGWAFALELGALLAAALAAAALWNRRYGVARVLAAAEVSFILVGWAAAQYPYLVVGDLTLSAAAAPPQVQRLLLYALAGGVPVLVPSLVLLYRVFAKTSTNAGEHPH